MPFWRSVSEREKRLAQGTLRPAEASIKDFDYYKDVWQFQEVRSGCSRLSQADRQFEPLVSFSGYEQNRFFYNLGDGRFEEISGATGLGRLEDGRALVRFDFDRDGDLDLLLWNYHRNTIRFLRNEIGQRHAFLGLNLRGKSPNTFAIGARVVVRTDQATVTRVVNCGEGYLSCNPAELLIGLGKAVHAEVEVTWPGGTVSRLGKLATRKWYQVREGGEKAVEREFSPGPLDLTLKIVKPRVTEGDPSPAPADDGTDRVFVYLANAVELPEAQALKMFSCTLFVPPIDYDEIRRSVASFPSVRVARISDADRAESIGDDHPLPVILVVGDGRIVAKLVGVSAGARAQRWLAGLNATTDFKKSAAGR